MIPAAVRCILFDAVGTLIYADPPVHVAYASAARNSGLSMGEAVVERRLRRAFAQHDVRLTVEANLITSEDMERTRWRAIVNDVFPELAPCEVLFERLWNHFAQPANWRLFDDVAECWWKLQQRGLIVGVASNFDQRLYNICRGLPPLDRCDHYFVSSQIGFRKPAQQFFRAMERATELEPPQLLLVGDDWDTDYRAATAAGWHALHLNRASDFAPAASIHSFAELR